MVPATAVTTCQSARAHRVVGDVGNRLERPGAADFARAVDPVQKGFELLDRGRVVQAGRVLTGAQDPLQRPPPVRAQRPVGAGHQGRGHHRRVDQAAVGHGPAEAD